MRSCFARVVVSFVLAPLVLAMGDSSVRAQGPLEKLRVAYTVIAPTQANVWVAKELGFYAKHGLDVDLVLLVGAPLAVAALVSGETPISPCRRFRGHRQQPARLRRRDHRRRGQSLSLRFFVTDQIKRVEDLRGKKFGVSRIGSADNASAVTVLEQLRHQGK